MPGGRRSPARATAASHVCAPGRRRTLAQPHAVGVAQPDLPRRRRTRRLVLTTKSQAVALTFDDGPDPVDTPRLLALLRERRIHATFCMVGFRVRDRPDLVRAIHADGHTLCNHSWLHLLNLAGDASAHISRVVREVKSHTRPASIVLSHDNGQPNTVTAYQILLPWLQERFTLEGLPTSGL